MPKQTFLRLDEEKQERIMRTAIEEFQKKGFADAKIGRIAKKAGIAKGSIYQYFEDKVDFFLYAVKWTLHYAMTHMDQIKPFDDMDVFDYLLSAGRQKIELSENDTVLMKFSRDFQSGRYSELTHKIQEGIRQDGDAFLLRLIRNGKNRGTIRQDVDNEVLMLFYKGVMEKLDDIALRVIEDHQDDGREVQVGLIDDAVRNFSKLIRTGMGS